MRCKPLCARLADPPTREVALAAFAQAESACQAANPNLLYADLLAATHRTLTRNWGGEPDEDREHPHSANRSGDWSAFADAAESLAYLKRRHRLITLTNCDRAQLPGKLSPPRRSLGRDPYCRGNRLVQNRRWLTLNSCSPG